MRALYLKWLKQFAISAAGIAAMYFVMKKLLSSYEDPRIKSAIEILTGLSVILVVFQIVVSEREASRQREFDMINKTQQTAVDNWIQPNIRLAQRASASPELVGSLYTSNPELSKACNAGIGEDCAKEASEQVVLIDLFQQIENFLTNYKYDASGADVWLAIFLEWSKSKEMRDSWKFMKHYYRKQTGLLVELLFEYVTKNPPSTPDQVTELAKKVAADDRYQDVLASS